MGYGERGARSRKSCCLVSHTLCRNRDGECITARVYPQRERRPFSLAGIGREYSLWRLQGDEHAKCKTSGLT